MSRTKSKRSSPTQPSSNPSAAVQRDADVTHVTAVGMLFSAEQLEAHRQWYVRDLEQFVKTVEQLDDDSPLTDDLAFRTSRIVPACLMGLNHIPPRNVSGWLSYRQSLANPIAALRTSEGRTAILEVIQLVLAELNLGPQVNYCAVRNVSETSPN